jgi:hypothetical protein
MTDEVLRQKRRYPRILLPKGMRVAWHGGDLQLFSRVRTGKGSKEYGVRDRRYSIRCPFAADAEMLELESGTRVSGVTSDLSLGGCLCVRVAAWRSAPGYGQRSRTKARK